MNIYAKYHSNIQLFPIQFLNSVTKVWPEPKVKNAFAAWKRTQKIIASQHGELHLANFPRNTLIFNISRQFQYLFDANMLGSPFYNKFNYSSRQRSRISKLRALRCFSFLFPSLKRNFKYFNRSVIFLSEIFIIKESEFSSQFPLLWNIHRFLNFWINFWSFDPLRNGCRRQKVNMTGWYDKRFFWEKKHWDRSKDRDDRPRDNPVTRLSLYPETIFDRYLRITAVFIGHIEL